MRTLLLMRHAKSSWKDASLADEKRPLNERGKGDAGRMGEFLRENKLTPGLVLSSPAKRARQTAKRVVAAGDFHTQIDVCPALYFSGAAAYIERIGSTPSAVKTLLLIGHNPDIEGVLARLTGKNQAMPTAAVARIEVKGHDWRAVADGKSVKLKALYRPKELLKPS